MNPSQTRPILHARTAPADFADFYWLKEELQQFCREVGMPASGSKIELTARVLYFLQTGRAPQSLPAAKRSRPEKAQVKGAPLSLDTLITPSYRNSEEHRRFFKSVIGARFHFTTNFMRFCRENVGKTLGDAVQEWHREQELKKDKNYKTVIAPQFEYNRYIRDFLHDNPGLALEEAIRHWQRKKAAPGSKAYTRQDLDLLRED